MPVEPGSAVFEDHRLADPGDKNRKSDLRDRIGESQRQPDGMDRETDEMPLEPRCWMRILANA